MCLVPILAILFLMISHFQRTNTESLKVLERYNKASVLIRICNLMCTLHKKDVAEEVVKSDPFYDL